VEIIEFDSEVIEVIDEFFAVSVGQLLGSNPEFSSFEHDRRAVCVRRTDINAIVPTKLLESNPDIGLNIFNQMSHMRRAVDIGQSACDKNFSFFLGHFAE